MEPGRIPVFATEAEEARWWYENREELAQDFIDAIREGRTGLGSVRCLEQRRRAGQVEQKQDPPIAS